MRTASLLALGFTTSLVISACSSVRPPSTSNNPTMVAGAVATPTDHAAVVITATPAPTTPTVETSPTASTASPTPYVPAALELSKYAGRPGESLGLRAQGFSPDESVHLEFEGSPAIAVGDAVASDRGEITVEAITIPNMPEGQHTLAATGTNGVTISRVVSIVGFHPWVILSSYAIHPGEAFGFNGSEFVPGEQVRVFLDDATSELATVHADGEGSIAQEVLLRAVPAHVGKHNLQFVSSSSNARLPVSFEVLAFVPIMELTTYAGPAGSQIGFTGHGFAPGEKVHVYRQADREREEIGSFEADYNGAFQNAGTVTLDANGATTATLILEGDQSHVPVSQQFGFLDLAPWAGLSQYSGPVGAQVDVLGKGFAAGETVDVTLGGERIATGAASSQGELQVGPVVIPTGSQGTLTFTLHGGNSKGEASTSFTVTGS